jgi:hypothetical protein
MLFCGPEFWALAKEKIREVPYLRADVGYEMDNKHDEYVREEIDITFVDIIKKNIKKFA